MGAICHAHTSTSTGWMLIVVDAPGAYAVACVANTSPNHLALYDGISDSDITGVDMTSGHEGEILREDPFPIDVPGEWRLPFFTTVPGYTTGIGTITPRNRAEWPGGNLLYSYAAYGVNAVNPISWTDEKTPGSPPGVLHASGPIYLNNYAPNNVGAAYITTPSANNYGYSISQVNADGFAIYINNPPPVDVELIGHDRIDEGDSKSLVIKYIKKPEDVGEITLKITKQPNTAGDAQFENSTHEMVVAPPTELPPSLGGDEASYVLVWIKGVAHSGVNDKLNFVVEVFDKAGNKIGNGIKFRVLDRDTIFQGIEFSVDSDDHPEIQRAPHTWGRDPLPNHGGLGENKWAALDADSSLHHGGGADNTFHWNPSVTMHINNPNLTQEQKNDMAKKFIVGFIQNVVEDTWEADYEDANGVKKTVTLVFPYYPILDVAPSQQGPDWEKPPLYLMPVPFTEEGAVTELGGCNDSPGWGEWSKYHKTWVQDGVIHTGNLIALRHICHFKTWIVVAYTNVDDKWNWGAAKRLKCVEWSLRYNATVDINQEEPVTKGNPCCAQIDDPDADENKTAHMTTVWPLLAREVNSRMGSK